MHTKKLPKGRRCLESHIPLLLTADEETAYRQFLDVWDNGDLNNRTDGEAEMYLRGWLDYACSAAHENHNIPLEWEVMVKDGVVIVFGYEEIGPLRRRERCFVWDPYGPEAARLGYCSVP